MKKLLLITILFISGVLFSQENQQKKDVKVGLVLSGGGVNGIVELGSLKALEKLNLLKNIKNYCGSSIGSLI